MFRVTANRHYLVRASSGATPQATPESLSSMQTSALTDTTHHVSALRQDCLVRDHHRCVVCHKFDLGEAGNRGDQHGDDCEDDGGSVKSSKISPK